MPSSALWFIAVFHKWMRSVISFKCIILHLNEMNSDLYPWIRTHDYNMEMTNMAADQTKLTDSKWRHSNVVLENISRFNLGVQGFPFPQHRIQLTGSSRQRKDKGECFCMWQITWMIFGLCSNFKEDPNYRETKNTLEKTDTNTHSLSSMLTQINDTFNLLLHMNTHLTCLSPAAESE